MSILKEKKWAYLGLLLVALIVGLSFIFVKTGLNYASSVDLLAHRFTAGALVIGLLWIFGFLKFSPLTWGKAKSLLLLSFFFPLMFFGFQTFGMQYSTASEAGIIFASVPIITLLVASLFLKEKSTTLQKIGIILSMFGIVYILFRTENTTESTSLKGVLLLFLSILSVVTYYALGKKRGGNLSVLEITVWMTLLAFIVFNVWSVVDHIQANTLNEFFHPLKEPTFLWSVLYLGILSSVVTSLLTNYALSKIEASQIAVFNNLNPIIAVLGGVVILKESLHTYQVIGGLLVIAGVIMTQVFVKKEI